MEKKEGMQWKKRHKSYEWEQRQEKRDKIGKRGKRGERWWCWRDRDMGERDENQEIIDERQGTRERK